jgi:DNA replication protein DnaC
MDNLAAAMADMRQRTPRYVASCEACQDKGGFEPYGVIAETSVSVDEQRGYRVFRKPIALGVTAFRRYCTCSTGRALDREHREAIAAALVVVQRARWERLWGQLPSKYQPWTLDTLRPESAKHRHLADRLERDWLPSDRWLYLFGPVGTAKTGFAVGLGKRLAQAGQSVGFQEVSDLLEHLRAAFGEKYDHENPSRRWESLFDVDVLILDDLGAERATDWAVEKLWQLIGHRHREERRTIVTSNLSLDQLTEHLKHERLPSRLFDAAEIVSTAGLPNLRGAR